MFYNNLNKSGTCFLKFLRKVHLNYEMLTIVWRQPQKQQLDG